MSCANSNAIASSCSLPKIALVLGASAAVAAIALYLLPLIATQIPRYSPYFALVPGSIALICLGFFAIFSYCQKKDQKGATHGNRPPSGVHSGDNDLSLEFPPPRTQVTSSSSSLNDQKEVIYPTKLLTRNSQDHSYEGSDSAKNPEQNALPLSNSSSSDRVLDQPPDRASNASKKEKSLKIEINQASEIELAMLQGSLEWQLPLLPIALPPFIEMVWDKLKQAEEKEEALHYLGRLQEWVAGLLASSIFSDPTLDLQNLSPSLKKIQTSLSDLQDSWERLYTDLKGSIQANESQEARQQLLERLQKLLTPQQEKEGFSLLHIPALAERARQERLYPKEITSPWVQKLLVLTDWIWEEKDLWIAFLTSLNTSPETTQQFVVRVISIQFERKQLSAYLNLQLLTLLKEKVSFPFTLLDSKFCQLMHQSILVRGQEIKVPTSLPEENSPFYKWVYAFQKMLSSRSIGAQQESVIDDKQLCYCYSIKREGHFAHQETIHLTWSPDAPNQCQLTVSCLGDPQSPDFWQQWQQYLSFTAVEGRIPSIDFLRQGSSELTFQSFLDLTDATLLHTTLQELEELIFRIGEIPCTAGRTRQSILCSQIFSYTTGNWDLFPSFFWHLKGLIFRYLQTYEGKNKSSALRHYGTNRCQITLQQQWCHLAYLKHQVDQLDRCITEDPQPEWWVDLKKNIQLGISNFSNPLHQANRWMPFDSKVYACDGEGKTVFLKAVEENNLEMAEKELNKGANVDAHDLHLERAISHVLRHQNKEMLHLLLKYLLDLFTPLGKKHYPVMFLAIDCYQPNKTGRQMIKALLYGGIALDVSYEGVSLNAHLQAKGDPWLTHFLKKFQEHQKAALLTPDELQCIKNAHQLSSNETKIKYFLSYNTLSKQDSPQQCLLRLQVEQDREKERTYYEGEPSGRRFRTLDIVIDDETGVILESSTSSSLSLPPNSPLLSSRVIFPLYYSFLKWCRVQSHQSWTQSDTFTLHLPKVSVRRTARHCLTQLLSCMLAGEQAAGAKHYCLEYTHATQVEKKPLDSEFLTNLMAGLTSDPFLHFCTVPSSGLLIPTTQGPYLPHQPLPKLRAKQQEARTYYYLGALFAFCATHSEPGRKSYCTGRHFDEPLFAALSSFTDREVAEFSLNEEPSLLNQLKIATALLKAYGAFDILEDQIHVLFELLSKQELGAQFTEEETQKASHATHAIFGYKIEGSAEVGRMIAPIAAILCGMHQCCSLSNSLQRAAIWRKWTTGQSYHALSQSIQGSFDRIAIGRALVLDKSIPPEHPHYEHLNLKRLWLQAWIEAPTTSDQEIRAFLLATCGNRSLGCDQQITLKSQTEGPPTPFPIADPKSASLYLAPFPCFLQGVYDGTRTLFLEVMKKALEIETPQEQARLSPSVKKQPIELRYPVAAPVVEGTLEAIWQHLKIEAPEEALHYLEQLKMWVESLLATSPFPEKPPQGKELSAYLCTLQATFAHLRSKWTLGYEKFKIHLKDGSLSKQVRGRLFETLWTRLFEPGDGVTHFSLLQLPNLAHRARLVLNAQEEISSPRIQPLLVLNELIWKEKPLWIAFLKHLDKQPEPLQEEFLSIINEAIEKNILIPYLNLYFLSRLKKEGNFHEILFLKDTLAGALKDLEKASHLEKGPIYQVISAFHNLSLAPGRECIEDRLVMLKDGKTLYYSLVFKIAHRLFLCDIEFSLEDLSHYTLEVICEDAQAPKNLFADWRSYFSLLAAQGHLVSIEFDEKKSEDFLDLKCRLKTSDTKYLQWVKEELNQCINTIDQTLCMGGMHRVAEIGGAIFSKEKDPRTLCPELFWRPEGVVCTYLQTPEGEAASLALLNYGSDSSPALLEQEWNHLAGLLQALCSVKVDPFPACLETLRQHLSSSAQRMRKEERFYSFNECCLTQDKTGKTPFRRAVDDNDLVAAEHALSIGAHVDSRDHDSHNALYMAILRQDLALLQLLICYRCDLSSPLGKKNYPVAFWAMDHYRQNEKASKEFVKYLLLEGMDLDVSYQGKSLNTHLAVKGDPWLTKTVTRFQKKQLETRLTQEELQYFKECYEILRSSKTRKMKVKVKAGHYHYFVWFEKQEKEQEETQWLLHLSRLANNYERFHEERKQHLRLFTLTLNAQGVALSSSYNGLPPPTGTPLIAAHFLLPIYLGFVQYCKIIHGARGVLRQSHANQLTLAPFRIHEDACYYLDQFSSMICQKVRDPSFPLLRRSLTVKQGTIETEDLCMSEGGLSLLIEGLLHSPSLSFFPLGSGISVPITYQRDLSQSLPPKLNTWEEHAYYNLGTVFALCLNSSSLHTPSTLIHYTIGQHFDDKFFKILFSLSSEEVKVPFRKCNDTYLRLAEKLLLDVYKRVEYQEAFSRFKALASQDLGLRTSEETKEVDELLDSINKVEIAAGVTLEQELAWLYAQQTYIKLAQLVVTEYSLGSYNVLFRNFNALCEKAKKESLTPQERTEAWNHHNKILKIKITKKVDLSQFLPPIQRIAQGIYASSGTADTRQQGWQKWLTHSPQELTHAIQGSLNRLQIANSFVIDSTTPPEYKEHLELKRTWLVNWILSTSWTSESDLCKFLRFVTGSPMLSPHHQITLSIQKDVPSPIPHAHTPSRILYLAPYPVWLDSLHDGTASSFFSILSTEICD